MITLEINNQLPRRMDLFSAIERTDYHQNVKDDLVLFFMDNFNSKELLDIYWTCGDLQELIGANREEMEKLYGIIIESYGLKEKEKIKVIKQLLNKSK